MSTLTNGTITVDPQLIDGYESTRPSRNVVHAILGTNVPAFTLREAGLRTGKLRALVLTRAVAVSLETMLSGDDLCTLTDADDSTLNMTFVCVGDIAVSLDDDTRSLWWVEFEYQEVS